MRLLILSRWLGVPCCSKRHMCSECPMPLVHAYVFREAVVARGSAAVVCVVDHEVALSRLGTNQLEAMFGGYATYSLPSGQLFIGVWGSRNASRLRRFLREGGSTVLIRHGRPPELTLRSASTQPGRRPAVRPLSKLPLEQRNQMPSCTNSVEFAK